MYQAIQLNATFFFFFSNSQALTNFSQMRVGLQDKVNVKIYFLEYQN